nr:DNA helicase [Tanacetum cinerariifolium]
MPYDFEIEHKLLHIPKKLNLEFGDCVCASVVTNGRNCTSEITFAIDPMHETLTQAKIDAMKEVNQFASNRTNNDGGFVLHMESSDVLSTIIGNHNATSLCIENGCSNESRHFPCIHSGNDVMPEGRNSDFYSHNHNPLEKGSGQSTNSNTQFPLIFVYGEEGYHKGLKLLNILGMSTKGLYDAIMRGDRDGSDLGTRLVLSTTFTGGLRYMYSHYLDALAIFRVHGNPSFFINFTCNTNWPEIEEYMDEFLELTSGDRADIVNRVFEKKVRDYIKFVRSEQIFGDITAFLYTIEFQKRRLPHYHSLLWLNESSKIRQDSDVDKHITAELPTNDEDGYRVISELMMHGPCGHANSNATCMKDGTTFNRNFPKPYSDKTFIDKDGYVHYRRRKTGIDIERQSVWLDNSKGTDRLIMNVTKPVGDTATTSNRANIQIDVIKNFVEARYIGPHEACWRILDFPIHYHDPAVQILAVHSENMQRITSKAKDNLLSIIDNPMKKTTLTEWLDYNKKYTDGRHLTYLNFPSEYTCERYYDIRRVIDHSWNFKPSTTHYIQHIRQHVKFLASLEILMFCEVSNPMSLWQMFWKDMSDDIPRRLSKTLHIPQIEKSEVKMKASVLFDLKAMLNSNSKSLKDFGLSMPLQYMLNILQNKLLLEEKNYNLELLSKEKEVLISKLNTEQKAIFDDIVNAINNNIQILVIVYGYGGTGKTRLWKAIACALRLVEKVVLAVASSGTCTESDMEDSSTVQIPPDLCIVDFDTAFTELINFIYNETALQRPTAKDLQKKDIVCPKNETAYTINEQVLSLLDGPMRIYLSSDEATPHGDDDGKT